ncbi:MAG: PASTA domain-containing protein [Bacteroidia bacterium]|nr:PASTA domain-containing protein [Bacteroidia bacterium]
MLRYFISREFFLTLAGLFVLGILLYLAIFFWILPGYARHGKGITVPDVQQLSLREAMAALEEADLRPVVLDSTYLEGVPPGTVLRQYPEAYKRVKPDRTISLTINQQAAPMVSVPEITDMILYQAKVALEGRRLSLGRVTLKPDIAKDVVLDVFYQGKLIRKGEKVPVGAKIDVNVGKGQGSIRVAVPDLTGLTYEEALNVISSSLMQLGGVSYNPGGSADQMGRVYNQRPRASFGDSILTGSPIDIFVYGSEPVENETPLEDIE